jgi:large subunit ribosomal protein L13e
MVKHNVPIVDARFKKDWDHRQKLNFDIPQKRKARRAARKEKARKVFPRPIGNLKPLVHCPTIKYNRKLRLGRGFTLQELKAAKISPSFARTIGISVDERRTNASQESLQLNTQRLVEYTSKLILFPKRQKVPKDYTKMGGLKDSSEEERKNVTQQKSKSVLPFKQTLEDPEPRVIEEEERTHRAFKIVRNERKAARNVGFYVKKKLAEAADLLKQQKKN